MSEHALARDARNRQAPKLGAGSRLALGVVALGLVVVLGLAFWLEPDPRGFGTHTQLGLPPCSFRVMTGMPCPGCGMTTAMSWAARGRMIRSAQANPAGAVLAPVCLAMVPWLVAVAVQGRPAPFRSADGPIVLAVLLVAALALANWAVRITQSLRSW